MDLNELKVLAGITGNRPNWQPYTMPNAISGTKKAEIMREKKIQPGTQEWFRLWFARPDITGEQPY
jgi:hypothetical protein